MSVDPWLHTANGRALDLLHPVPAAIVLGEVAFALAYQNRFAGHAATYSVAQHSVLVARALRDEGHDLGTQRAGLGHDGHEYAIGDVSSPVKRAMRELMADLAPGEEDPWTLLERRWALAFRSRFRLSRVMPASVVHMDARMTRAEARDLLGPPPRQWGAEPWPEKIQPWDPDRARDEFLEECARLEIY